MKQGYSVRKTQKEVKKYKKAYFKIIIYQNKTETIENFAYITCLENILK